MGVVIVSMPSQAYTSFLPFAIWFRMWLPCRSVNALSGLYLISTKVVWILIQKKMVKVSMPSRAYTSFLHEVWRSNWCSFSCVSMPSRAYTSFLRSICLLGSSKSSLRVNALSGLYLISTFHGLEFGFPIFSACQCPLGLIPHFYGTTSKT